MALLQRQMACFENNKQFLGEVAAILLPIAATMYRGAMMVENNPDSQGVERAFAAARKRIAEQILSEQGITVTVQTNPFLQTASATGGSNAMKYLVQQMLLMPTWTLTPDEWADDEAAARATIQASMAALLESLTAIPVEEA